MNERHISTIMCIDQHIGPKFTKRVVEVSLENSRHRSTNPSRTKACSFNVDDSI